MQLEEWEVGLAFSLIIAGATLYNHIMKKIREANRDLSESIADIKATHVHKDTLLPLTRAIENLVQEIRATNVRVDNVLMQNARMWKNDSRSNDN